MVAALLCVTQHAAIALAQSASATPLCDAIADRIRAASDVGAGKRTVWSLLTIGQEPMITVASTNEVELGPNPDPDVRSEFEKRIRARYGNADAVMKDLRTWDNLQVLGLTGSRVRMVLTTAGAEQCESRYFFRVTTSREGIRVADPPEKSSRDADTAICNSLGGWGYFAWVDNAEAFVEYHASVEQESLRIVPLLPTYDGWGPACTVSAHFLTTSSPAKRGRLEQLNVTASK